MQGGNSSETVEGVAIKTGAASNSLPSYRREEDIFGRNRGDGRT